MRRARAPLSYDSAAGPKPSGRALARRTMSDQPESQVGGSSNQQGGELSQPQAAQQGVPQGQPGTYQGQPSGAVSPEQVPQQAQPGVPPQSQPYQQPGPASYQGMPPQGGASAGQPFQGQSYPGGVPPQGQPWQPGVPPQGQPYQGGVPPQGQPAWQPHVPGQRPVKNHQTSSLVLGILSIFAALLSPLLAFVLGGIGLAFASSDRRNFGPQASRAGRICSIVGIVLGVVMWIASFVFLINTVDPSVILNGAVPEGTPASTSPLF